MPHYLIWLSILALKLILVLTFHCHELYSEWHRKGMQLSNHDYYRWRTYRNQSAPTARWIVQLAEHRTCNTELTDLSNPLLADTNNILYSHKYEMKDQQTQFISYIQQREHPFLNLRQVYLKSRIERVPLKSLRISRRTQDQ